MSTLYCSIKGFTKLPYYITSLLYKFLRLLYIHVKVNIAIEVSINKV